MREKDFSYLAPIGREEQQAALAVIQDKKLSGFYNNFLGGERVRAFEQNFADYLGVQHAIAVNSGTSALHVALAAAGIRRGDEVIVPAFSFTATAAAVLMNNATPVFVDIEPDTFCIDPKEIGNAITKRTKAIIPVHIYGKVAKMEEIKAIAAEHNMIVIEDACQAPGSTYQGQGVGAIGEAGCFSFVETKNIVIGEGGMITTNDEEIAERCRLIRNHGEAWVQGKPREYWSTILGYNFRLNEIAAAIGIEQLKKLDQFNRVRQENTDFLQQALSGLNGIQTLRFTEGEICHLFSILFDEKTVGISKAKFMEALNGEGIPVSAGYPHPLYKNPIFQENKEVDYKKIKCVAAEMVCNKLICLPRIHYPYGIEDMRDIVNAFKKVLDNKEALMTTL